MVTEKSFLNPADFYHAAAAEYNSSANRDFYQHIAGQLLAMVRPEKPVASILEVGAGTGFTTELLQKGWPGAEITAIEPSPGMQQHAEKKNGDVNFLNVSMADLKPRTFDLVVSSMSYHWLTPAEQLKLAESASGGLLALAVPVMPAGQLPSGNRALLKALRAKPAENRLGWNRKARQSHTLFAAFRRRFNHIQTGLLELTEKFPSALTFGRTLWARGVLYALAPGAQDQIELDLRSRLTTETNIPFVWSIALIVAR